MNKKKYEAPELDVLILEQTDIITTSPPLGGGGDTESDGDGGIFDEWD